MGKRKVSKTYEEINARIKAGEAVVVTAEEMVSIVRKQGPEKAASKVDVVTTGTFSPMCSSGAFINFGHTTPTLKASRVLLNNVPAYAGLAAVDIYLGATEPTEDDPLNKVYPGEFRYGGGHVIEDLVAGRKVALEAIAYGTDCYPAKKISREITLEELPFALLTNPRNGYQNYNCAVNLSDKTIYTYMGTLKPNAKNANYCSAGELSPLMNDPLYKTIGLGTKIFLGGGVGFVTWNGTQHNPNVPRTEGGAPTRPAGTLMVQGDLKQMSAQWLKGISMLGRVARNYGEVSYGQLLSGEIEVNGKPVQTAPLSSYIKAREIAETLKKWIQQKKFTLNEPLQMLPTAEPDGGEE